MSKRNHVSVVKQQPNATFQGENIHAEHNNSSENVANTVFYDTVMASFCIKRLLFTKKFTIVRKMLQVSYIVFLRHCNGFILHGTFAVYQEMYIYIIMT